jgi:PTH2 family peptidyl-tRNA hydrolase
MNSDEYKQVIIIRGDIAMSKGKLAVQAAHAAVGAALEAARSNPSWLDEWIRQGQKKVLLKVNTESEMLKYAQEAQELGLPTSIIRDAGRTELPPGTLTAVGIGPAPAKLIDKVTGHLKLY